MNIVHVCLNGPYTDNWGYQENLLPKYQKRLGNEVTVITMNTTHVNSAGIKTVDKGEYFTKENVKIIRLDYRRFFSTKISNIIRYFEIYDLLCILKPDAIMVHGLVNISAFQVAKYKKKNPHCVIIADTHADYFNAGQSSKRYFYKLYYLLINFRMKKYYSKVYGVTPGRITYAVNEFKIPLNKMDLLIMGGDDDKIDFKNRLQIRNKLREQNQIANDDFLIVTGGKIDKNKNIHLLMQAVREINNQRLKLVVFGEPTEEMKEFIRTLSKSVLIRNIGWIGADVAYDWFLAADLAVFPGSHSVLWEQACACGIPGVFRYREGMTHVDVGGNCKFLYNDSVDEIRQVVLEIFSNSEEYSKMKQVAMEIGIKEFSYAEMAKRTLEHLKKIQENNN